MSTRGQINAWDDIQAHLSKRQEQVLAVIKGRGIGATLREIADILGIDMSAVSGRVTELQELKLVYDSGHQRVNPKSGKMITVWIPTGPKQIGLFK